MPRPCKENSYFTFKKSNLITFLKSYVSLNGYTYRNALNKFHFHILQFLHLFIFCFQFSKPLAKF